MTTTNTGNYCVIRMHYCYIMGQYSEALQMGNRAARAVDVILSFKEAPGTSVAYAPVPPPCECAHR
jgi:hypothetical protein